MRRSDEFQPADLKGISMIPFGLLAGFMDEKEIRITELAEEGFRFRLSEKAVRPKSFYVCFYDMERSTSEKICLQDYKLIEIADETVSQDNQKMKSQKTPGFRRDKKNAWKHRPHIQHGFSGERKNAWKHNPS